MKPRPGADASGNFFRATEFANNAKRLGPGAVELHFELTHSPIRCWYRPTKTVPGPETMTKSSSIRSVETLSCDAGWRNYHFVKITTEDGIVAPPAELNDFQEEFLAARQTLLAERAAKKRAAAATQGAG